MEKEKALDLIKELSNANGVSGFEDEVVAVLKRYGKEIGELSEDRIRNLFLKRQENKENQPIVHLDAHTDEVGFMVQAIKPNGTLVFLTIGGWVASNIPAHRVRIRNSDGVYIPGIIASQPPHFMSESDRNKPLDVGEMVIDIGSLSYDETVNDFKIKIGAPVVPDVAFEYFPEKERMFGKAFDCRIGCAAMLDTIGRFQGKELPVNVIGSFSSQEEVGDRGIKVAVKEVQPDIAIVFEGCPADDTFSEPHMIQSALSKGPMLRHMDVLMITNPRFQKFALDVAGKYDIPVQESVRKGGGTNGAVINLAEKGVPTIVLGIPVRYAHTHYSIVSFSDYQHAVNLAVKIIEELDAVTIASF